MISVAVFFDPAARTNILSFNESDLLLEKALRESRRLQVIPVQKSNKKISLIERNRLSKSIFPRDHLLPDYTLWVKTQIT